MTLGDIIKQYREEHKLSMDSFAEKSGISKAYISLLEKNKHPKTGKPIAPSIKYIKQVSDAIGMDFNELFNMIDSEVTLNEKSYKDIKPSYPSNLIPLTKKSMKKVHLVVNIACGTPTLADENIMDYVDMDNDMHADFALRCKGDSMINARIFDGDIVYIKITPQVENGEIAAVLIDNVVSEATLKRFYKDDEKIRLCAENPMYKDLVFFHEEMNDVHILGKAVAFLSAVK